MARYVDADALIAEIKSNINTYWNENGGGYYLAEDAIEYSVKTATTADVVPRSEVENIFKEFERLVIEIRYNADYTIFDMQKDFANLRKKCIGE